MGSLETGKVADLIVLDRDCLTIPDREMPSIKVLLTMVGGRIEHLRPEFAREIRIPPVGPATWPTNPLERWFYQPEVRMPSTAQ